jgi:16S rRNA (cytosine967-C5)-methyltransferase
MTTKPTPLAPTARAVALDILGAVLPRGAALDEALAGHGGMAGLETRDRAFARLLIATTLRRLGQIDELINACLDHPLGRKAGRIRHILRLGICQLVFLGVAPHAAVHGMVELVGENRSFRGLVNAVLRRMSREGGAMAERQDAARLNTPDWLWRRWSKAYGETTVRSLAEAHLADPPLDFTLKDGPQDWAARLDAVPLPTGSLRRVSGGAIETLDGYGDGAWWVQDTAAALPARLLGKVDGATVLDLCAAPGGKTAQLAAAGANVIAVDRDRARLARLKTNLERLDLTAEIVQADAAAWRPRKPAGHILLDAPCSATGTIRRHPDIPHLKQPGDIARLIGLQDRLLDAAAAMLAPGGLLVYCVCSLEPEEGPERIAALLARNPRLARESIASHLPDDLDSLITDDGDLRTLPCHLAEFGGLDGFYAARLRRLP